MISAISILIPSYKTDVNQLVSDLHRQAILLTIPFEILVREDGEHEFVNQNTRITQLSHVKHLIAKHAGRAAGRNLLAKQAQYDFLLFIDSDSGIVSDDYLKNFCLMHQPSTLTSGGRIYQTEMPKEIELQLHWKWGKERELLDAKLRNTIPENCFLSNNFMVDKKIILEVPFNETLVGYGYEDTLFAFDLKEKQFLIHHIENPVMHLGLETSKQLLQKTDEAMMNLLRIMKQFEQNRKSMPIKSKLTKAMLLLQFSAIRQVFANAKNMVRAQLLKSNPSLFWFDVYRLCTLATLINQQKKQTT